MSSSNATVATFNLEDASGKYSKESDRACIALGAADLNAELGVLFQQHLTGDHQLLGDGQPLGAFSTRIRLAHALGWFSEDIRHDLERVRTINDIKLGREEMPPFKYWYLAECCGALKVGEKLFGCRQVDGLDFDDGSLIPTPLHVDDRTAAAARRRFEVTVELIANHLQDLASDVNP